MGILITDEYRNELSCIDDPNVQWALNSVKRIHMIRLKLQEALSQMNIPERVKFFNSEIENVIDPMGIKVCYNSHSKRKWRGFCIDFTTYLETSVLDMYYETEIDPIYIIQRAFVLRIFELIREGEFDAYVSVHGIKEIMQYSDIDMRNKLLNLIKDYNISVLPTTEKIEYVTESCVAYNIAWSTKCILNASHVVTALHNNVPNVISFNYAHIANSGIYNMKRVCSGNIFVKDPMALLEMYADGIHIEEDPFYLDKEDEYPGIPKVIRDIWVIREKLTNEKTQKTINDKESALTGAL